MEECNAMRSPIDINIKMDKCNESERADVQMFQVLMGRLMYLSVYTKSDLSFALSCHNSVMSLK